MIEGNYFEDNEDLRFLLRDWIKWDLIVPLKERDFEDAKRYQETKDPLYEFAPSNVEEARELYRAVHQQYGEIAGREVAPVAKKMEKEGLRYDNGKVYFPEDVIRLVNLLIEAGILVYSARRKWGGLFFPQSAVMPILEMVARADAAFGIIIGCYNLAEVIDRFGDDKLQEEYIPKMVQGEIIGAMALTEPDYGSDLRHIKTRAEKKEGRIFLLNGTKRFITHGVGVGDRPAVILTLARSKGEGGKGLSFFAVHSKDVYIAKIEEKLGLHISPTCEVIYEDTPGYLIGEEGYGLVKYAIEMMNGARLGIATQALGIQEAVFREAKKYASERIQFGVPIEKIPAVKRMLDTIEAKLHATRAIIYRAAEIVDLYDGLVEKAKREGKSEREIRKDKRISKWDKLAKLFTPVAKYFSAEECNKIAYDGMQVFGGSGYIEEYDMAKLYRDARITSIYEGTSQLQVVAAIPLILEGVRPGGTLSTYLREEIDTLSSKERKEFLLEGLQEFEETVQKFRELSQEERGEIAHDIVSAFSYLLGLILLEEQRQIAKEGIREKKEKVIETFRELYYSERKRVSSLVDIKRRR